jgi:hypothetical protein
MAVYAAEVNVVLARHLWPRPVHGKGQSPFSLTVPWPGNRPGQTCFSRAAESSAHQLAGLARFVRGSTWPRHLNVRK